MSVRLFSVGMCVAVIFALGCGGESASYPPPDYPQPATTESGNTSTDKPAENDAVAEPKPAAESKPAATTAPADSGDKPVASDKPATSEKPAEKPAASDVPGANISVGRLEADGLVTKNIECKSDGSGGGLGLLGAILVTAWMSPQKKALDACGPAGQESETRVVWKARGGKVTEIEAKGDTKVKACVEKALRPGKPVFEGHCAATVMHGKK